MRHCTLTFLFLLVVVLQGCGLGSHPMEGQPVPDLPLKDLRGVEHHLGETRGQTTLLVFWTDCAVCRAELPWLDSVYRRSGGALQVLAVNSGKEAAAAEALAAQLGLTFPLLLDPQQVAERAFQVVTVPTTFQVDPEGRIVAVQVGSAGHDLALKLRSRPQPVP